jgi:hypothetical protein
VPGSLDRAGPTVTRTGAGMRRGSGRHRTGP